MMSYSKGITISLVAAVLVATLGLFVISKSYAHEHRYMGHHVSWHHDGKKHGERFCGSKSENPGDYMMFRIEKNMDFTAEQEPKWENVKAAFESGREDMQALCADFKKNGKPEEVTARLELMEKVMATRLDSLQKVRPAVEDLYASLDDEQKESLNKLTSKHRHFH